MNTNRHELRQRPDNTLTTEKPRQIVTALEVRLGVLLHAWSTIPASIMLKTISPKSSHLKMPHHSMWLWPVYQTAQRRVHAMLPTTRHRRLSGDGLGLRKRFFCALSNPARSKLIGVHGIVGTGGHQLGNHLVRPARRECPEVNGLANIGRVHIFQPHKLRINCVRSSYHPPIWVI